MFMTYNRFGHNISLLFKIKMIFDFIKLNISNIMKIEFINKIIVKCYKNKKE